VFFVISGYLITSLISEEIRQQRFSIITFYERRVRRIFPALLLVMVVSSLLATWLLLPLQFNNFAKAEFATSAFASNVLFWRDAGYFAPSATEQPLLDCSVPQAAVSEKADAWVGHTGPVMTVPLPHAKQRRPTQPAGRG